MEVKNQWKVASNKFAVQVSKPGLKYPLVARSIKSKAGEKITCCFLMRMVFTEGKERYCKGRTVNINIIC